MCETPRLEIALVGPFERVAGMHGRAHGDPHPNRIIVGGDPSHQAIARLPAMEGRADRVGEVFVCLGTTCQEPAASTEALDTALKQAQSVSAGG